jgi:putative RecB family exonuclease
MAAVWSHSRLSSYENCPKQFHYRYVERRSVDVESVEAFVGKRVHAVLERLNHFVGRGLVPSLEKVLARFRIDWAQQYDPDRVRIVRTENPPEAYREMGERCLSNHYRRHYPFDGEETLGVEEHVTFVLDAERRYRMQGIVDRVARAPDGALEIHDYKTGRRVPSQEALDADRQLALYQIGVEEKHGPGGAVRLVWHYLLRNQVRVSTRTPEQLDTLRARTIELIDRIEAERAFDPRPGPLCTWCEHNDVCPAVAARRTAPPRPGRGAIPDPGPARDAGAQALAAREPEPAPATRREAPSPEVPAAEGQLRLL